MSGEKLRNKGGKKDVQPSAWKDRIKKSKDFQKRNSRTWQRNEKLLYGTIDGTTQENTFAYGWGLVENLTTQIYIQNPDCIMEPYDLSRSFERGTMWTSIVQYDIDMMDIKSIGNVGLIDNFVYGYFACIECLDTDKESKVDTNEAGEKTELQAITDQRYTGRRIHPRDILFDWQGTRIDLSDARFLFVACYPTITELEEGKERGDYPDLPDRETLMGLPVAYEGDRNESRENQNKGDSRIIQGEEKDPAFRTVCMWEVHDKINKKVTYVLDDKWIEIGTVDWVAKFKIGQRDMFAVTLMALHPVSKGFYPKPEIDLIASQLIIINKLDDMIYRQALTKWNKFGTFAGWLTPDKLAKVIDPAPENAIIELDMEAITDFARANNVNSYPDIRQLLAQFPEPTPSQDLLAIREMAKQEIMDIIGYGPPARGGMPATRSAREAVAIKENLDERVAKRADAVAEFYRLFGSKHFLFLQQTMEISRYARVFDFVSGPEFKEYAKDDLAGGFNFRVFAGTSGPMTTESKRSAEMQLFQTLLPLVQAGMIPPEPPILRLAKTFQWADVGPMLKNYIPATQELAMLLQALKTQPDKVPPTAILEAASKVVMAVLTPQQIQAIQTGMSGRTPSGKAQEARPAPTPAQNRGDPDALGTSAGTMQ